MEFHMYIHKNDHTSIYIGIYHMLLHIPARSTSYRRLYIYSGMSILDYGFLATNLPMGRNPYGQGIKIYPTFENVYLLADAYQPNGEIWNKKVKLIYKKNMIAPGYSRVCVYTHMDDEIYRFCYLEEAVTSGMTFDPDYNYHISFLENRYSINSTLSYFAAWNSSLSQDEIIDRLLNFNLNSVPVGRNASLILPQGGGSISVNNLVFDGDGDPIQILIERLPLHGNIEVNGVNITTVPIIINSMATVKYLAHDAYAANIHEGESECLNGYDGFQWRTHDGTNPGFQSYHTNLCLENTVDTVQPQDTLVPYRHKIL